MNNYRVFKTDLALKDLKEIAVYISLDNSIDVAMQIIDDIEKAINNLYEFPLIGSIPKSKTAQKLNYKVLIVGSYNIYYLIQNYDIYIVRIRHGAISTGKQI